MNFKRKLLIFLISFIFIIPFNAFAYSKYLIPGGEAIGISIDTKGVVVVGFYKVNGDFIAEKQGLKVGDRIISINDHEIENINDLSKQINVNDNEITLNLGIIRNNEKKNITLRLNKDKNGYYKTGMYVKDSVTGIGTMTFKTTDGYYGSLGHAITDDKTNIIFTIKDGNIYDAEITSIQKSSKNETGEKNAKINFNKIIGSVLQNNETGIYGEYDGNINEEEIMQVAQINEVTIGKAEIITVLENNKKEHFAIEILSIDEKSDTKNFKIRLTDERLIKKTGGIIKGMSGSPIIQNNKIVGAVTHAILNNPTDGYGISIIKMLESME